VLSILNVLVPRDHVHIGGNNATELIRNLMDFTRILNESGLHSKYLISNPFYEMEVKADASFYSGKPTLSVPVDAAMEQFQCHPDAVLIYPDGVHGDLPYFTTFMERLSAVDFSWLGIEMLPSSMQQTLDRFAIAPTSTPIYAEARKALTDYFFGAWTPYFKLNITSGEQSPYFQAIDMVRRKGGRIYGLDLDSTDFLFFRYGETEFGAAVRNINWAESVPVTGRGILFGGSAHFNLNRSTNVQDFLRIRNKDLQIFASRSVAPKA
jgi:hypothetical protein